jgi:hypothetical protein
MNSPLSTRRSFLQRSALAAGILASPSICFAATEPPLALGSRRELLVDDHLLEKLTGVALTLHKPEPRDVVFTCDKPWEGNTSGYYSLFEDEGLFRCYYRGSHNDITNPQTMRKMAHAYACYAESRDGLRFTRPTVGAFEVKGTKENNVVWMEGNGAHNFTVFKDLNPACQPQARYKALGGVTAGAPAGTPKGLFGYQSSDALHWSQMSGEPLLTNGHFDSQNLAFWDSEHGEYRAYWRFFKERIRSIRTATSKDMRHWENEADLVYEDPRIEELYTNAAMKYARAPHLTIAFPTRYQKTTQEVEPIFMSSRDGVRFRRWDEAIIPLTAPQDRAGNRSNYAQWGLLQLPGQDRELSLYALENYYRQTGSRLRRFVYRTDGFVSARAQSAGGSVLTKPITFTGTHLSLNITSRSASRAELQGSDGAALPGFALADCAPIQGDFIDHTVSWKGGDLTKLAGQPVRLRVELQEADLYALQFTANA